MFTPPPKTLLKSLHKLLDYAQEYVADVRFDYPCGRIWAHRAILLARAPEQFRTQYLSELTQTTSDVIVFSKPVVPYAVFLHVLRFWYTAEFYSPEHDFRSSVSGSSMSELSLTSSQSSATFSTLPSEAEEDRVNRGQLDIIAEIQCHEKRLGTNLLPTSNDTPAEHLIADINRMWRDKIATDVVIKLLSNPKDHLSQQQQQQCQDEKSIASSLPAHRFMLAVQSSYFNAMFCKQFREASSSTVYLPSDLFTPITLQVILRYFYTDEIHIPPLVVTNKSPRQVSLINKKHALRILQDVFRAADYLGQYETVCLAALHEMDKICHHFKCACPDCSMLLPAMLWFAETYKGHVVAMHLKLIALYADPLHSLAKLWSTEPFAILIRSQPTMAAEIMTQTLENIKKHTAIQILECLHLCLSRLRSVDPVPSWSAPVRSRITQLVSHTVSMISDNFGFYCVEYPILLSCVDGIGVGSGLSVDFLDFLLKRVVDEGINDRNAGEVYQGIVRDLIGRQEVDQGRAVDHVLIEARQQCIDYLSRRWPQVKAEGGFKSIEKDVMRCLSEDINVPYRALTKSFDADIASLFGFKSRAQRAALRSRKSSSDYRLSSSANGFGSVRGSSSYRRLSMLSLRSQRSQETLRQEPPPGRRSADLILTQPRGRSFSLDSAADLSEPPTVNNTTLAEQTLSTLALADALLALDQVPSNRNEDLPQPETTPSRRTRLKFELPKVPERPSSVPLVPNAAAATLKTKHKKRGRSPLRYRLGLGNSSSYYSSGSDASDDDDPASSALVVPVIGAKVELLRRPLPMTGVIKYIGPVHFAKGTYVGVELESRLGSNDGSYEGTRYFQTDPQRGAFCKLDDFKIISLPHRST